MIKDPPAMQVTWVGSLGQEDPLQRGMAPLQYPCLGNPMDRGAWRIIESNMTEQLALSFTLRY